MPNQEMPAIVVVTFPAPKDLDEAGLRALIEEAGPNYINVPGLRRKYFLSGDGVGGGIYEWDSRENAEAFYDETWHAEVRQRFGTAPTITIYEAAAIADGVNHELTIF